MNRISMLFFFAVLFTCYGSAQQSKVKVEKYSDRERTTLARFDTALKPDRFERDSLRSRYAEHVARMSIMLDTLEISDKRRQRLFKELKKNPFSEKLLKIVTALALESYE